MNNTYGILDKISSPQDLKGLSREELELLADEIRSFILQELSPVGGHLASSLGVVELTVALHTVFNTPEDRIIWDVGHQCYPHKILTGRRDTFNTIRQKGGLSGFPKRSESPYDAFGAGHSSTSISAGLGMAVARDLEKGNRKIVCVIGDGSMTAGLAFEGLNHAGHLDKDLLVVLNDNEMSISKNVGALSAYLSRLMTGNIYSHWRKDFAEMMRSIPSLGEKIAKFAKRVEEHVKGFISPGMLFEELNFTYVGPIDGHNLEYMLGAFTNVAKFRKPVLLHVVTCKGKGFAPAEKLPTTFHGVGPFDPFDGTRKSAESSAPTYTEVFREAIVELAEKNDRIVAITAAMPEGTGLDLFRERFPDRFFDVGIAEQHAVTFAAGLAAEGFIPIVAVYSTFMQRAYDQVVHDVALQDLPVILALDRAGIVGADGPTHHGSFDFSYLRHIPGMTIFAPSEESELRDALATAVALGRPAAIRYPRGKAAGVDISGPPEILPLGKGRMISGEPKNPGILILSAGAVLSIASEAAELARKEDIQASVFDVRYIKPLDREAILSLCSAAKGIVTIEENALAGGFGSSIIELLIDEGVALPPIHRVGLPDTFISHGSQDLLRDEVGLSAEGILQAVRQTAGKSAKAA